MEIPDSQTIQLRLYEGKIEREKYERTLYLRHLESVKMDILRDSQYGCFTIVIWSSINLKSFLEEHGYVVYFVNNSYYKISWEKTVVTSISKENFPTVWEIRTKMWKNIAPMITDTIVGKTKKGSFDVPNRFHMYSSYLTQYGYIVSGDDIDWSHPSTAIPPDNLILSAKEAFSATEKTVTEMIETSIFREINGLFLRENNPLKYIFSYRINEEQKRLVLEKLISYAKEACKCGHYVEISKSLTIKIWWGEASIKSARIFSVFRFPYARFDPAKHSS